MPVAVSVLIALTTSDAASTPKSGRQCATDANVSGSSPSTVTASVPVGLDTVPVALAAVETVAIPSKART